MAFSYFLQRQYGFMVLRLGEAVLSSEFEGLVWFIANAVALLWVWHLIDRLLRGASSASRLAPFALSQLVGSQ